LFFVCTDPVRWILLIVVEVDVAVAVVFVAPVVIVADG
jgi:hypothetical protein